MAGWVQKMGFSRILVYSTPAWPSNNCLSVELSHVLVRTKPKFGTLYCIFFIFYYNIYSACNKYG